MMSTENLLGEFKEAEQPNPRSLNSSIQIDLELGLAHHSCPSKPYRLAVVRENTPRHQG